MGGRKKKRSTLERDGEEADLSPSSVDHRTYQTFNTLISVKSPPTFRQESSGRLRPPPPPSPRPEANVQKFGVLPFYSCLIHRSGR